MVFVHCLCLLPRLGIQVSGPFTIDESRMAPQAEPEPHADRN